MFQKLIKNPVIIAVIAGAIVFAYMSWNRKQENEKRLKKGKKIKEENKYDNIIIPIVTAVIVWFIAYGYFNNSFSSNNNNNNTNLNEYKMESQQLSNVNLNANLNPNFNQNNQQYRLAKESGSASDVRKSFTLVNKTGGISLPTVPDMFIDFQ